MTITHQGVTMILIFVAIIFGWAAFVKWCSSYRLAPLPDEDEDGVQCEACSKVIRTGMGYSTTVDGCTLCEDCAPSFQDCVDYWRDQESREGSMEAEELEAATDARGALAAHVALGGSPHDKPLWVMP